MFEFFFKKKPALPLFLYNTLSRKKEEFVPIKKKSVTMYSCGPTVYDYATIGNFRSYVFADTLKRVLQRAEFDVNHTVNLTDFGQLTDDADAGEDKMIKALKREGFPISLLNMAKIAERYSDAFVSDMGELNVLPPTQYTPASEFVDEQIELIETLGNKGYTYETSDGVYFDISKFEHYGELGDINLDALKDGARVAINKEKKHPADFALWKKSDLGWESVWGKGFPGWHIECTAMILATLGDQIDIHTGGEDLAHTHHNGEIAQAEAATGKRPFVRYWMHNAFITINEKRVGKSEGNAITLKELKEEGYAPLAYRYWLLTSHYRSPINFTFEALDGAAQALRRLQQFVIEHQGERGFVNDAYAERFTKALNDDLNTAEALAIMWELVRDDALAAGERIETLRDFDNVLGLALFENLDMLRASLGHVKNSALPKDVSALLEKREDAREKKDFKTADEVRNTLKNMGYEVSDTAAGQEVRKL